MASVQILRGLTDSEVEELKASAKLLGLKVNIRTHREKYAAGAVDIRPTVKDEYRWTEDQFLKVRAFVQAHNLETGCVELDSEHAALVYASGFNYMRKRVY
jgi:hypothetical protein